MTTLREHRRVAAEASQGTSSPEIKDLVVKLIERHDCRGHLLDYGAGQGELINRLAALRRFSSVSGADLLPKPQSIDPVTVWFEQDLNNPVQHEPGFEWDTVICSETIEHLENPWATMRDLACLTRPGGILILTMPNQESIRSFASLLVGGHHVSFLGASYPAHITALVRLDLVRMADRAGFELLGFHYTDVGGIPNLPRVKWQHISFGLLRGRLFSDNVAMVARKRS